MNPGRHHKLIGDAETLIASLYEEDRYEDAQVVADLIVALKSTVLVVAELEHLVKRRK